ncbi:MAG: hypothetical protein Q9197_005747 [Variospora fuerteventurae]
MEEHSNVSSDLIWEVCTLNAIDTGYAGPNNAFLVKRKSAGGSQFSRDPFNLMNKHSRKHEGFVNNKVCASCHWTNTGEVGTARKCLIYKGIVNYTAKQNYRADLRQEAVARASAIRQSNRAKKATPGKKLRGAKAKAAAEKDT